MCISRVWYSGHNGEPDPEDDFRLAQEVVHKRLQGVLFADPAACSWSSGVSLADVPRDVIRARIASLRAWAPSLPDEAVRRAYEYWADQADVRLSEREAMDVAHAEFARRLDAMAARVPDPPFAVPSPAQEKP